MSESEVKARLREWLAARSRSELRFDVGDEQDLILQRVVDSLLFVEFVLFVEELSGRSIPPERLRLEDFRTLERIWRTWFQEVLA